MTKRDVGNGFFGEHDEAANEYGAPKRNKEPQISQNKGGGGLEIARAEASVERRSHLHQRFFQVLSDIELLLETPTGVDLDLDRKRRAGPAAGAAGAGDIRFSRKGEITQAEDMRLQKFFNPNGLRMIAWDTVVIGFILYSVFQVPLRIGFMSNMATSPGETVFNYIVDAVFFMDILVTFNVPYFERLTDALVLDRGLIARRYLSFWFWIDFAAALPFEEILSAAVTTTTSQAQLRAMKLIRILRLTRLGKLHKLTKYGAVRDALDDRNISPAFMNFITLLLQVVRSIEIPIYQQPYSSPFF